MITGKPLVKTPTESDTPRCKHGERVHRSGTSKTGRDWAAWFCTAPKGAGQCEAQWEDVAREPNGESPDSQPVCDHGTRIRKGGVNSKNRPWIAFFCPAKSCEPLWGDAELLVLDAIEQWATGADRSSQAAELGQVGHLDLDQADELPPF